jgi:DNA-binding transcriptional LysR family regulator
LQEEACGIIAKGNEAVNRARLAESGIVGKLNIGLVLSGEKKFLSQVLKTFRRNYPNIDLNITRIPLRSPNEALVNNLDIGITLILEQDILPGVGCHLLYSDVASVVVPLDHRWANETSLDLSALNREPIVTLTRETAPAGMNWLMQTCSKRGKEINFRRTKCCDSA